MHLSSIVILISVVGKPILAIPVPVEGINRKYPGISPDGLDSEAMAIAYCRLPEPTELPLPPLAVAPGCEYRDAT
jgi:hypothetical protein